MAASLRLIALLPPDPLSALVRTEQERIAATWGPHHALRTPPHITIIPPIEIPADEIDDLEQIAVEIARDHSAFSLRLRGYGAFPPRVVFMKPMPSEALDNLYRDWRTRLEEKMPSILARYPEKPYRPHMTLAHRDVTDDQFHEMWMHYGERRLDITFKVKAFSILDGTPTGWIERSSFALGIQAPQ